MGSVGLGLVSLESCGSVSCLLKAAAKLWTLLDIGLPAPPVLLLESEAGLKGNLGGPGDVLEGTDGLALSPDVLFTLKGKDGFCPNTGLLSSAGLCGKLGLMGTSPPKDLDSDLVGLAAGLTGPSCSLPSNLDLRELARPATPPGALLPSTGPGFLGRPGKLGLSVGLHGSPGGLGFSVCLADTPGFSAGLLGNDGGAGFSPGLLGGTGGPGGLLGREGGPGFSLGFSRGAGGPEGLFRAPPGFSPGLLGNPAGLDSNLDFKALAMP